MKKFIDRISPKLRPSKTTPRLSTTSSEPHIENTLALHEIYTSPNPTLTFIAIHGHTGSYQYCFTHPTTSCFWLRDLLPPLFNPPTQIRVLSLSYSPQDEDTLGTEVIARFVIDELGKEKGTALAWIAHSYGGPTLKGILSLDPKLVDRTRAVLFFGVPRASGMWSNMALATAVDDVGVSEEIRTLQREVKFAGKSEKAFAEICDENKFKVWWFLEVGGETESSSRGQPESEDVIFSGKTHNDMMRFEGPDDIEWKKVQRVLVAVAGDVAKQH